MRPNTEMDQRSRQAERPSGFEAWVSIASQVTVRARFAIYVPLHWTIMKRNLDDEAVGRKAAPAFRGRLLAARSSASSSCDTRPLCER